MTISRRNLLAGGAATAALAACSAQPATKFRSYQGPQVTGIVVRKAERRLFLLNGQTALKAHDVQLGFNPLGHKLMEGDGRTPEGPYRITYHNPNSRYHLSVGISYPDTEDVARAAALGVSPGGDIMIHGTPDAMRGKRDWTAGCIAISNEEIEWLYAMVQGDTPVTILP